MPIAGPCAEARSPGSARRRPPPSLRVGDAGGVSSISCRNWSTPRPGATRCSSTSASRVGPGERAVLVGVNGIGKSTILRILSGELQADEGEFALGGTVLTMAQDAGMAAPDATRCARC